MRSQDDPSIVGLLLSERQEAVLRAVVASYVGGAAPISSAAISHVLPTRLSSASVRNTLAELAELGLVDQPHTSAGRVPTEAGLRFFIDRLLGSAPLPEYDRRAIDFEVEEADPASLVRVTSQLLSRRTQLLGFVVAPRLHRVVLQHVSLVRIASDRILAVLVSTSGSTYRRVLREPVGLDQRQLDRVAALLNERVEGRTLPEVRAALARETEGQRRQADLLLAQALALGAQALSVDADEDGDVVIATRLALLDQPEFHDPLRIRQLFEAIDTKERLLEVLDQMLAERGVRVALGSEVGDPALARCALVASSYGGASPLGAVGVIGPSRMDYGRVMALVGYLADALTDKLRE